MPATVFIAEDHQIVRQGLRAILEHAQDLKLVGDAGNGLETVHLVGRLKPDVLVLDLMMPELGGLEAARQVRELSPRTKIVVLSMHSDDAYVAAAHRAGASAYVLKEAGSEELLLAIRKVLTGQEHYSPPLSQSRLKAYLEKSASSTPDPLETLTPRERLVMQLSAEGLSSTEIGQRLFISPRTVETHRANLMRKLGVRNLKELIRLALERGVRRETG